MKHLSRPLLSTLIAFLIIAVLPLSVVYSQDAESTQSGDIDLETIKENVKKRIEEVVKGDTSALIEKPVAYMGALESVANTTLSINTRDGIKQAATSAKTVFVRLPGNKTIKQDEIGIDEYVTAIGFMGTGEVLGARRVIVNAFPPEKSDYLSFFGTVSAINVKAKTITLTNPLTGDNKVFMAGTKAVLELVTSPLDAPEEVKLSNIPPESLGVVVYLPAEDEDDDNLIHQLLVKGDLEASPSAAPASASAKSSIVPPELRQ